MTRRAEIASVAYLVIREGSKWTDVFRLVPGESVTIGRAPTNQIVLKDERCSRSHAEVFHSQEKWIIRDLESRNGTSVSGERIYRDYTLEAGNIVQIGSSTLAFVHDLTNAFPDSSAILRTAQATDEETTHGRMDESDVLAPHEPTTITHRKGQTRFLRPLPEEEEDESTVPRVGRAATQLCRLAFELAKCPNIKSMAHLALDGLFENTPVDAGSVLLMPRDAKTDLDESALEVIASRTDTAHSYHRVSSFLAESVLREGEAVLARNVMDDSNLASRDSKGEIHTTSVICAPIRLGGVAIGLVHLYSTDSERVTDPDDLEFTLAVADTVAVAINNLSHREELTESLHLVRDENVQLRERLRVQSEIVGTSPPMLNVAEQIAQAAPSRATVLVRGESGVGKELVARAVHFSSRRADGPFVCLNCAALAETLLESELFGHEKGAFTGATDRKIGKFENADSGTLMLDEIGEMSPQIQAKFLRVLEGHPFERVGGSEAISVDVRVIAATNRDLESDVAEGRFRRDLYFRLRVLEIVVPGLRKRTEDIAELADYFLHKFNLETGKKIQGFTPEAMEQMMRYRWPGNVRELKNVVERAVVLARGNYIEAEQLVLSSLSTAGDTINESDSLDKNGDEYEPSSLAEMEKVHILNTLNSTHWNKSQAASILGIERSTLDRKIRRYNLRKP